MVQKEPFAQTLYDYAADLQWVRMLDWSEDELRSVPVHEELPAGQDTINLADFGGTSLGVLAEGSPTSADARAIRNMWVVRNETPPALWQRLKALADRGGPSGYNESGQFGERGEAEFPPSGQQRR